MFTIQVLGQPSDAVGCEPIRWYGPRDTSLSLPRAQVAVLLGVVTALVELQLERKV